MKESIIAAKSFHFAISVVELYKTIIRREKEFVMSKQLLRSGTSVGANIAEASGSISKREFIAKMQISYKEAHESLFWITLLKDTNFINEIELLLIFHSHVVGCEKPSEFDEKSSENCCYPFLIYSINSEKFFLYEPLLKDYDVIK